MVPIGLLFRPIPGRTYVRLWRMTLLQGTQAVMTLLGTGLSDYRIAAQTGVSRATVRNWRLAAHSPQTVEPAELAATWSVRDGPSYCYLLGAYLRDGTIHAQKGMSLCIVNDRRYAGVSSEILGAMATTFSGRSPRVHPSSSGESDILCISHPAIVRASPQHGPGRKHLRSIVLADWQLELTPCSSRIVGSRTHPLRRLPGRQSLPNEAPEWPRRRVLLRALLLQQPLL